MTFGMFCFLQHRSTFGQSQRLIQLHKSNRARDDLGHPRFITQGPLGPAIVISLTYDTLFIYSSPLLPFYGCFSAHLVVSLKTHPSLNAVIPNRIKAPQWAFAKDRDRSERRTVLSALLRFSAGLGLCGTRKQVFCRQPPICTTMPSKFFFSPDSKTCHTIASHQFLYRAKIRQARWTLKQNAQLLSAWNFEGGVTVHTTSP